MKRWFPAIALIVAVIAHAAPLPPDVRRVVFLGDSITYGGQYVEFVETWLVTRQPERQLEVLNVGLPSETVSGLSEEGHAGGKFPRPDLHERLERVLAQTKPDYVIACYGMNCGIYLPLDPERFKKFQDGMKWLHGRVTATGAKILHATPPTYDPRKGPYNEVLDRYSEWLLEQRKAGWDVVDLHEPMNRYLAEQRKKNPDFFLAKDAVHPNTTGHWLMAKQILLHLGAKDLALADDPGAMTAAHPNGAKLLALVQQRQRMMKDAWLTATGHQRPAMRTGLPLAVAQAKAAEIEKQIREMAKPAGDSPPCVGACTAFPGKRSEWHGYDRYDFEVAGKPVLVVAPKQALPGKPWAWRGEFFGAFANADVALLGRGFHLVAMRVPDMLGCPDVRPLWDAFYKELTEKHGFAKKMALIGLSRGGLYCYNWAIANPDKVACVYADAAVCDFKSWPGGKGKGKGSKRDWDLVMKVYHFASEVEALAYKGNPVDNLAPLAKAGVPLLHVYCDSDDVVPWDENTGVVAERYKKLGGSITLIGKPGVGHHPHGLADPTAIVDFIVKHASPAR
jgi:lysophospholipase L1-like esterase/pimeloyl-ACP methyl ester carboxylesterase